ncbi:hypothetical protein [Burkholderia sp. Bp9004]|uniref:hypothetical protein n=1 Tax=Burkholderia sp. Bp9004 TaxID=2184559 RepID=UPI000F5E98FA|nr:hypothetical protein [Burkholderia sp. Bp9004]RQZ59982.1 hypothetical protein DIE08_31025 [Burkholderia sp. Bp9004]
MTLIGSAFLALWNDIEGVREAEYDLWHTVEHVPQRVGVPGFLSGRRYRASSGAMHYFTLYDVTEAAVFESHDYLSLVNHPTAWSRAMRPSFRNVVRAVCRNQYSAGHGVGGALACVRIASGNAPDNDVSRGRALGVACHSLEGVTAVHFGERIDNAAPIFDAWQMGTPPGYVLLLEAAHESSLLAQLADVEAQLGCAFGADRIMSSDLYDLCYTV